MVQAVRCFQAPRMHTQPQKAQHQQNEHALEQRSQDNQEYTRRENVAENLSTVCWWMRRGEERTAGAGVWSEGQPSVEEGAGTVQSSSLADSPLG